MEFTIGKAYTRDQIHDTLGGEKQTYLPQNNGRVVCGCFSRDANPDAPEAVLATGTDQAGRELPILKKARMWIVQGGSIPVFLKEADNRWVYQGFYRVKGGSDDPRFLRRKAREAGREYVDLAVFLEKDAEGAEIDATSTYLLTWNPSRWAWQDLEQQVLSTLEGRPVEMTWSCGRNKHIEPDSRLFLLRQGVEPRGIIGAGYAVSEPFIEDHWEEESRAEGKQALMLGVVFDRLLNPDSGDEPLSLAELQVGELAAVNWGTQASGIQIRVGCNVLEELWAAHLRKIDFGGADGDELSAFEGEMKLALRRHRRREDRMRQAKIEQAMQANKGRLICEVPGCGFEFVQKYGEIGRGFAHVHHLMPLGDRTVPTKTRLSHLAIVCPNCHAMIQRDGGCRPMETLIRKSR